MTANERHLRLVAADEAAREPAEEQVWRRGIASARAALAGGHERPETPGAEPEAPAAASFRPRLPSVEAAWSLLEGGHDGGRR